MQKVKTFKFLKILAYALGLPLMSLLILIGFIPMLDSNIMGDFAITWTIVTFAVWAVVAIIHYIVSITLGKKCALSSNIGNLIVLVVTVVAILVPTVIYDAVLDKNYSAIVAEAKEKRIDLESYDSVLGWYNNFTDGQDSELTKLEKSVQQYMQDFDIDQWDTVRFGSQEDNDLGIGYLPGIRDSLNDELNIRYSAKVDLEKAIADREKLVLDLLVSERSSLLGMNILLDPNDVSENPVYVSNLTQLQQRIDAQSAYQDSLYPQELYDDTFLELLAKQEALYVPVLEAKAFWDNIVIETANAKEVLDTTSNAILVANLKKMNDLINSTSASASKVMGLDGIVDTLKNAVSNTLHGAKKVNSDIIFYNKTVEDADKLNLISESTTPPTAEHELFKEVMDFVLTESMSTDITKAASDWVEAFLVDSNSVDAIEKEVIFNNTYNKYAVEIQNNVEKAATLRGYWDNKVGFNVKTRLSELEKEYDLKTKPADKKAILIERQALAQMVYDNLGWNITEETGYKDSGDPAQDKYYINTVVEIAVNGYGVDIAALVKDNPQDKTTVEYLDWNSKNKQVFPAMMAYLTISGKNIVDGYWQTTDKISKEMLIFQASAEYQPYNTEMEYTVELQELYDSLVVSDASKFYEFDGEDIISVYIWDLMNAVLGMFGFDTSSIIENNAFPLNSYAMWEEIIDGLLTRIPIGNGELINYNNVNSILLKLYDYLYANVDELIEKLDPLLGELLGPGQVKFVLEFIVNNWTYFTSYTLTEETGEPLLDEFGRPIVRNSGYEILTPKDGHVPNMFITLVATMQHLYDPLILAMLPGMLPDPLVLLREEGSIERLEALIADVDGLLYLETLNYKLESYPEVIAFANYKHLTYLFAGIVFISLLAFMFFDKKQKEASNELDTENKIKSSDELDTKEAQYE